MPRRTIARDEVVDAPVARDAYDYALKHSSDIAYKHVMRSWLLGALAIEHRKTIRNTVDSKAHAVVTLLYDLSWDQTPGSPFVSHDKRFEVDGAIAAREFIRNNNHGKKWDERRVQLVWDAIALHTQPSISDYKELEVSTTGTGVTSDFQGPIHGITKKEYSTVLSEFPSNGMRDGLNNTIIWFCQLKPATTYGELILYKTREDLLINLQIRGCNLGETTISQTTSLRETGFLMSHS